MINFMKKKQKKNAMIADEYDVCVCVSFSPIKMKKKTQPIKSYDE